MAAIARNILAVLILEDGSGTPKTLQVYPQEGDVSFTETYEVEQYKHRGDPITDTDATFTAPGEYQSVTFTFMVADLSDAVKTHALLRWMKGDSTTTTAVAAASWTSTTSRSDSKKTLNAKYYPHGTGSGKSCFTIPDCLLESEQFTEGKPSMFAITLRSTTASKPEFSIA